MIMTFRYPANFNPELLNTTSALYQEITAAIVNEVSKTNVAQIISHF